MADVNEVLTLIKGSSKPFDIFIFDQRGAAENLAVFDQATLSLREEEGGSTLLLRRTADVNLSINSSASKLTGTLLQADADSLKTGEMIIDVALRETSSSKWFHLDRIRARILNSFAPHTP